MAAQLELILGGARSGKSRLAEQRVLNSGMNKIYVATATANDEEMAARIEQHRQRRQKSAGDEDWHLIEEPVHLSEALQSVHDADTCILVDCLTLWLSNCLHKDCWLSEHDKIFTYLPNSEGRIIFVSNEVGSGIVPMGELTRQFVDFSGQLHQELAAICQRVTLTVAGLSVELKTGNSTIS